MGPTAACSPVCPCHPHPCSQEAAQSVPQVDRQDCIQFTSHLGRISLDSNPQVFGKEMFLFHILPFFHVVMGGESVRVAWTVWQGVRCASVHCHPGVLTLAWRRGSEYPPFGLEIQLANLSGGETKVQSGSCHSTGEVLDFQGISPDQCHRWGKENQQGEGVVSASPALGQRPVLHRARGDGSVVQLSHV